MDKKNFNLNESFDSTILKDLSISDLSILSNDIRNDIIKNCSIHGGHLASNLGIVELTIALHKTFNFPTDKLLFDVGHQCYTHKILTGRPLTNLREENGVAGFPKRSESIYDPYEPGHSSTSISTAMGMAIARDLNHDDYNIIALIGDSSISNGLAFEALNNLGQFNHKIIIVLNDNEMSITEPVGGMYKMLQKMRMSKKYLVNKARYRKFMTATKVGSWAYRVSSKFKSYIKRRFIKKNLFDNLNLFYIGPIDGYDFEAMEKAFEQAKKATGSVVIHVSTIKGKGYTPAEINDNGNWHGVSSFDVETGKLNEGNVEEASWSKVYARFLELVMKENPKTSVIYPATGSGSYLNNISKLFPDRSFDVGIAEEHAMTMASGIALSNYHPYVSIYSSFMQRSYDQINHDIARLNLPVTILVDRAGLVGQDGETHQGIFDEAFLMGIPNISICMAKNQEEAGRLMMFSSTYDYPLVIRYPRANTKYTKYEGLSFSPIFYGEWEYISKGENLNIALISFGPVIEKLETIFQNDNDVTLINAIFQMPINDSFLKNIINYKTIVVYDLYGTIEGFGYSILNSLKNLEYKGKIELICLHKSYPKCATIERQEKLLGVDLDSVVKKINNLK